jgi:hypothetical protein
VRGAGLAEDLAHRVLARAIELDARRATEVPVAHVREIARDRGISEAAFTAAWREMIQYRLRRHSSTPRRSVLTAGNVPH